jgi:hypothetical protein
MIPVARMEWLPNSFTVSRPSGRRRRGRGGDFAARELLDVAATKELNGCHEYRRCQQMNNASLPVYGLLPHQPAGSIVLG